MYESLNIYKNNYLYSLSVIYEMNISSLVNL
jgi:hypothetical protein